MFLYDKAAISGDVRKLGYVGLYRGDIGIMAKKMEATIVHWGLHIRWLPESAQFQAYESLQQLCKRERLQDIGAMIFVGRFYNHRWLRI